MGRGDDIPYERTLILMCDYTADPVWRGEGRSMAPLETLPVTAETRTALKRWADTWDVLSWEEVDDPAASEKHAPEWEEHRHEGVRLWKLVREELGPEWRVGFFLGLPDKRVAWDPAEVGE